MYASNINLCLSLLLAVTLCVLFVIVAFFFFWSVGSACNAVHKWLSNAFMNYEIFAFCCSHVTYVCVCLLVIGIVATAARSPSWFCCCLYFFSLTRFFLSLSLSLSADRFYLSLIHSNSATISLCTKRVWWSLAVVYAKNQNIHIHVCSHISQHVIRFN